MCIRDRRKAWHILNRMENVGGDLNAYTNKEETMIYSAFLTEHFGRADVYKRQEEGGDGLLRACRKLVGVSGGRRDVEVVVAEAVVFHADVFVHSKGGKHKCRYDACAPFARRAMDNDCILYTSRCV